MINIDKTTFEIEYQKLSENMKKLKDGENLISITPIDGGFFLGIGNGVMARCWKINQQELNKLSDILLNFKTNETTES